MGQQETMWATGGALRRMLLVLTVAAIMAALVAVIAAPAFARSLNGTLNAADGFGQGAGGGTVVNAGQGQGDPAPGESLPPGKLKRT